jgi:hypothetical protein
LEGLAMANLGIFYDHLVYFTAIGNFLWPFGIFWGHLVISPRFGILCIPRKIWQPSAITFFVDFQIDWEKKNIFFFSSLKIFAF